jgi:hypothetical protein
MVQSGWHKGFDKTVAFTATMQLCAPNSAVLTGKGPIRAMEGMQEASLSIHRQPAKVEVARWVT